MDTELIIPADSAEYLTPRPVRYRSPIVLRDGTRVDLNAPGPFAD
jgi:hypothetical protein